MWRWLMACLVAGCGNSVHAGIDAAIDSVVPQDGPDASLIAYYALDDAPADGVQDSSGHGHTGTCSTCPVLQAGTIGGGYRFDGNATLITIGDAQELRPAAITISAWVLSTLTTPNSIQVIAGKRYGPNNLNSWQLIIDTMRELTICATADATTVHCIRSPAGAIDTSGWHHVAMVWNGTVQYGYVDGTEVTEGPTALVYDAGAILLGGDIDGSIGSFFFGGVMDEVRIYNRALDKTEIALLATR